MKIRISNKLYIEGASPKVIGALKKSLTIPNPTYDTLMRRVRMTGDKRLMYAVKKEFSYYTHDKDLNIFMCGRGNIGRIIDYLTQVGEQIELSSNLVDEPLSKRLHFKGELRDYQVGAAEHIIGQQKDGVIKLGTGWGKSLIACEIIRHLNKTALIIIPSISILNQFKNTLKDLYDYEAGIIQGQNYNVKDITLASFATLKKRTLTDITKRFSIVIVDEAHTAISDKGIATIEQFNPKHLFGLTATPRRSDGQGEAIFCTFGPILIDEQLPQKKPTVAIVRSNCDIPVSVDYHEMIEDMIEHDMRNSIIMMLCRHELKEGRKILILTKRIAHYKLIMDKLMLIGDIKVKQISSDTNAKERDILLTKLRNNEEEYDVILGTFNMLSVGVDIPTLDTLVVAGDLKSSVLAQQSAGRVLRLFEGKKDPKIIDIDDNKNGILHTQHRARKKFYEENGWLTLAK